MLINVEKFEYLIPIQTDYRLITSHWLVDEIQQLERSLFLSETFSFRRDFFAFPFRKSFSQYYFLEDHRFFRQKNKYQLLINFLKAINSPSFFLSAPAYATLYPLEISVDCPFSIYKDAPAYKIEEITGAGPRPLQHPMSGAGFVIMPRVFLYDQSQQWAMLLSDNSPDLATVGLTDSMRDNFKETFQPWPFLSASQIIKTSSWALLSPEDRQNFQSDYEL